MFFFWQVLGAGSAHSRLLPHLKITNALEQAVGMTGAERRHVVWPLSSAAPTPSPARETPAAGTGAGGQTMLPAEVHGALCDMEIFSSLSSGWPLPTAEGATRGTCTTSRSSNGADLGCLPGCPIHPLPGLAGGGVIW